MSWIARRRIAVGMLSLCAFAGFAPCALAQETRATVTGTVRDAQGSVVPGATVTVLNTDTNVSYRSDEQRGWPLHGTARSTRPVKVTAALPGFKTFVREGVTLRTAETVTLAIQLSVGGLEETVTVSAADERDRVERERRSRRRSRTSAFRSCRSTAGRSTC